MFILARSCMSVTVDIQYKQASCRVYRLHSQNGLQHQPYTFNIWQYKVTVGKKPMLFRCITLLHWGRVASNMYSYHSFTGSNIHIVSLGMVVLNMYSYHTFIGDGSNVYTVLPPVSLGMIVIWHDRAGDKLSSQTAQTRETTAYSISAVLNLKIM